MADKIPPRFRKTKTEKWAVMAPIEDLEEALAQGGKIEVQKKSGDWSSFVVASLGNPFDVDGVQMCYGYAPGDEDDQGERSGAGVGSSADGDRSGTPSAPTRSARSDRSESAGRSSRVQRDPSEPMPDYQGGPEDEWTEF